MLSLAIFIPVSGWVADRFGARTVFRNAIAVFTIGSILCGLCNGVAELAAARILQGIGGAMMVPVGRLVMFRSVEKSEFVTAMAYLTVPALIGPILGPPVGGFITTYALVALDFLPQPACRHARHFPRQRASSRIIASRKPHRSTGSASC